MPGTHFEQKMIFRAARDLEEVRALIIHNDCFTKFLGVGVARALRAATLYNG